jgi:mono/diheme cytochrome c family protein
MKRISKITGAGILFVLLGVIPVPGYSLAGNVEKGLSIFKARNCASCHIVNKSQADRTIKAELSRKGPELWYAGDKFMPGFLATWLKNPMPIRPMNYYSLTEINKGGHARLSGAEADDVSAYLMSLGSGLVRPGVVSATNNLNGKKIFSKRLSCYGCHQVRRAGGVMGGVTGPTLADAGARLNPNWVFAFLKNPRAFKPVGAMPVYAGILNDAEIKDLTEYVSSSK